MLYPQNSLTRQVIPLPAYWLFGFDPEDTGRSQGWMGGLPRPRPIAVPASWNDQFAEERDNLGPAWYQTEFYPPRDLEHQRVYLRFDSVNYLAEVWLNGQWIGQNEGGYLPFTFDITPYVQTGSNLLSVRVDGRLAPEHVPPGNIPPDSQDMFSMAAYPAANFDFFPFCGIDRPVLCYTTPADAIADLTVVTRLDGSTGIVQVQLARTTGEPVLARVTVSGHGQPVIQEILSRHLLDEVTLVVPEARRWEPGAPYLYDLRVELLRQDQILDQYTLRTGIRTVRVEGNDILLNDRPIKLRGFGRHIDFPIIGRGEVPAVIVKDYALMEWIGANSFRTTHYPYSDQMMDLADQLGFLVIDETPAVGLFFAGPGLSHRLEVCQRQVKTLIDRDKNHPSVILWSLANEPHTARPQAKAFFKTLFDDARAADSTRPVSLVSYRGLQEDAFEYADVVCINRYYGWYSQPGQIPEALALLSHELDDLYEKFHKPVLVTEFGADALPGHHALPLEMFSEEYQAEFITRYIHLMNTKPFVVGQHVWNLCDFKTGQAVHRMNSMNYKGVFTRDRRPKLAASRLRELWKDQPLFG